MGQKVNPVGMRLGINKPHQSVWFASSKLYARQLGNDLAVRSYLGKRLKQASVARIEIKRLAQSDYSGKAEVIIHSARPGVVIGKKGADIEEMRKRVEKMMGVPVRLNIEEVRKPELNAQLVADSITQQLERRVMYRRAMKRAIQNAMRLGAKGIKIEVSGRLAGAEIARSERYTEGSVPLHTLRADVDYATSEALTTYGILGVKVWIFKGEILGDGSPEELSKPASDNRRPRRRPAAKPRNQAASQPRGSEASTAASAAPAA
jgi:small subunit ribosomal protein S3